MIFLTPSACYEAYDNNIFEVLVPFDVHPLPTRLLIYEPIRSLIGAYLFYIFSKPSRCTW